MQNEVSLLRWSKKKAAGEEKIREVAGLATSVGPNMCHFNRHKTFHFYPEQDSSPKAAFDPE